MRHAVAHLVLNVGPVETALDEQRVLQLEQLDDASLNSGRAAGLQHPQPLTGTTQNGRADVGTTLCQLLQLETRTLHKGSSRLCMNMFGGRVRHAPVAHRHGCDGDAGEVLLEAGQFQVGRPKVVAPLAHAVCFINGKGQQGACREAMVAAAAAGLLTHMQY